MVNKRFWLGILLMALVFGMVVVSCDDEDPGYPPYSNPDPNPNPPASHPRGYEKYEDLGLSWTDAKAYCERMGGHLVTITSAEEQNEVYNNYVKNGTKYVYWIGGYRRDGAGTKDFTWVTGEPWSYVNWAPGEPNNNGGENCAQMLRSSGKWNDGEDDGDPRNSNYFLNNTGFICEWD